MCTAVVLLYFSSYTQAFKKFTHCSRFQMSRLKTSPTTTLTSPPDAGTYHLSVLASNGDAVFMTTLVHACANIDSLSQSPPPPLSMQHCQLSNLMTDTGIVLNNEMDDFSAPNITNGFGLPPSNIQASALSLPRAPPLL